MINCKWITSKSELIEKLKILKLYFRISHYAVTSTPTSVIYFGGRIIDEWDSTDKVVEYKNLKWTLLGNLSVPRDRLSSIKMDNKIYLFGGIFKELYIEVWENIGDLTNPNYQGTILDNPNDFQFNDMAYFEGEIIRIKSDQCK